MIGDRKRTVELTQAKQDALLGVTWEETEQSDGQRVGKMSEVVTFETARALERADMFKRHGTEWHLTDYGRRVRASLMQKVGQLS